MTNLKQLIETSDFCEIYNRYAVWIADPKNKAMYFRNGKTDVKMGFSNVKSPYGLEAFLKTELRGKIVATVGQRASKYLLEEVETIERDANIFSEMFPNIIATKKNKLAEVQRKVNNTLNEHFEQASIEFPALTTKTPTSENERMLLIAVEHGATSVKTPDGYEIQF
jgi:hypothetical protein